MKIRCLLEFPLQTHFSTCTYFRNHISNWFLTLTWNSLWAHIIYRLIGNINGSWIAWTSTLRCILYFIKNWFTFIIFIATCCVFNGTIFSKMDLKKRKGKKHWQEVRKKDSMTALFSWQHSGVKPVWWECPVGTEIREKDNVHRRILPNERWTQSDYHPKWKNITARPLTQIKG